MCMPGEPLVLAVLERLLVLHVLTWLQYRLGQQQWKIIYDVVSEHVSQSSFICALVVTGQQKQEKFDNVLAEKVPKLH